MNPEIQPQARYILPSFVEHSSWGVKESNPYNKLFEERIIFLGVQIDDASANDVMAQLLCLESADPDREISMYINSPGGSFTSLMAIYDTMQFIRPDIQTVCLGQAASAAAVLLAAGTPGRRLAVQNATPATDITRKYPRCTAVIAPNAPIDSCLINSTPCHSGIAWMNHCTACG